MLKLSADDDRMTLGNYITAQQYSNVKTLEVQFYNTAHLYIKVQQYCTVESLRYNTNNFYNLQVLRYDMGKLVGQSVATRAFFF